MRSSWTQGAVETFKVSTFPKLLFCDCFAYISLVQAFNLFNLKVHNHEIPMAMLCTPHNSVAKRTS